MNLELILLVFGAIFVNTILVFFLVNCFSRKKKLIKFPKKKFLRKKIWIISPIAILLLGYFIFAIFFQNDIYHSPKSKFENGLNLIFFADQYPSEEEFDSDVSELVKGLRKIIPWNSFSNYNIHKIFPKSDRVCKIKTDNERKPTLRCDEKINRNLEKLELARFKLIVLSRREFQSWANVARLENSGIFFSLPDPISEENSGVQDVLFAHLMGHAFGLKDEEKFVLAKAGGAPHTPDGPNCAPDEATARQWWGDLAANDPEIGYFPTCCGEDDFVKPTQSSLMNLNSGMENFQANYGAVSERYLFKILNYCFSPEKTKYENDPDFFDRYSEYRECL